MTTETVQGLPEEGRSLLEMSDDDIANMDTSFLDDDDPEDSDASQAPAEPEGTEGAGQEGADDGAADPGTQEDDADDQDADADAGDADAGSADDAADAAATDSTPEGGDEAASDATEEADAEDAESKDADQSEDTQDTVDYKAEYERLLGTFKANGRDMQVQNVDEAIQLMQMGANYTKKMAALKPNLKVMKLLENNNLLDESKLGYLIDLEKKNPEAIQKLIKDSGIDPLDIDTQKESGYTPTDYSVDDKALELDSVLDEIQETPTYQQLLDVVGKQWDGPSQQVIADNPQLLSVINNHMASGIYDQIVNEVERERMFGRLSGISDLEAYRQVGDRLHSEGKFAAPDNSGQQQSPAAEPPKTAPAPKAPDPALKSKKRAAAGSPRTAPKSKPAEFNPLSMSDEDFEKQIDSRFM
ncbi:hypothetical protein [Larsenimonas suaedae]|uniref:Tape measure protein n=1 Tax=Larsenimonas suaedae TaxID=1851019 RepID=A0ABU1H147_9GAMM|nr:hypothetical protein [Larsenimonas suaedae]MCM2973730.1 hypothetical protein [Larsenimonas suaedae]MDR5897253.1 hypothetical protein [Larsenimonas suaedae]